MVSGAFLYALGGCNGDEIICRNLPFSATGAELEGLFGQAGAVSSANVISDKSTGLSRGFGFVEMNSTQDAQTAIEKFNGYELQGRALTVNETKPQENRGSGGRKRRW